MAYTPSTSAKAATAKGRGQNTRFGDYRGQLTFARISIQKRNWYFPVINKIFMFM